MEPTQQDLLNAMEREPRLTDFGIGVFDEYRLSSDERQQELKKGRQALLTLLDEFKLCCEWLALCERRKTVNPRRCSYGLKHDVEHYFDEYVSNGVFIAAVIHSGIKYEVINHGPNICVAISNKLPRRSDQ